MSKYKQLWTSERQKKHNHLQIAMHCCDEGRIVGANRRQKVSIVLEPFLFVHHILSNKNLGKKKNASLVCQINFPKRNFINNKQQLKTDKHDYFPVIIFCTQTFRQHLVMDSISENKPPFFCDICFFLRWHVTKQFSFHFQITE